MTKHSLLTLPALLATLACSGMIDGYTGADLARELQEVGLPAEATVLDIWETGVKVNDNPVVGFRLEIHAAGRAPWQAETKALISILDIPQIQPGAVLPVRFDPNDSQRVAIVSATD